MTPHRPPPGSLNVEIMKRMWVAWQREDMAGWLDFFDADAVWHTREDEPDAGTYLGREGIERLMQFWTDNFDGLSVHAEEFIDAGRHVVIPSILRGRGKASGVVVELPYTFACALEDQKVVEVREYVTKEEALEAVGQEATSK